MADSLADNFKKYFEIKLANTEALKYESYKIRHKVYAEELGWEPIQANGMETDECDPYALSVLLAHKRTKSFAGTVRLVIPPSSNPNSKLPFELHCAESVQTDILDPSTLTRGRFGEISRLSVPESFRRRLDEKNKPFIVNEVPDSGVFTPEERSNFPNIAIGLYLSAIAMAKISNHSHMFVVVEPRLCRRLDRLGLKFVQCGDELDFHGIRALFYLSKENFTSNFNPAILELYTLIENQLIEQLALYPN